MRTGPKGIALVKQFEQCRLTAYKPTSEDVWTCGWGSTKGVGPDTVWTQEQADAALIGDLEDAENCVNGAVTAELSENEFSSLVSLCFNIGCNAFKKSTLVRLLNDGDYDGASEQFKRWNKQNGKVLSGLTRRREAERALFESA